MNRFVKLLTVIPVVCLLESGCSIGPTSGNTQTSTPTASIEPSIASTTVSTPTPTVTLIPSITPTLTPLPNLPTPSLTHKIMDNLFFGGSSPDCLLPCWHGLRVNVSGRADIQQMFDRVFGFSGFMYPLPEVYSQPPAGYERIAHYWGVGNRDRGGDVSVLAELSKSTEKLESLAFILETGLTDFHPDVDPQRIIKALGPPKMWLISPPEPGGQGEGFDIRMTSLMIYDGGISFYHAFDLHVDQPTLQNGVLTYNSELCLNNNFDTVATIGRPLTNGFNDLTPIQEMTYGIREGTQPIQAVLGISVEEIVRKATMERHPCFPVSAHSP
jgi:hypothetical protein